MKKVTQAYLPAIERGDKQAFSLRNAHAGTHKEGNSTRHNGSGHQRTSRHWPSHSPKRCRIPEGGKYHFSHTRTSIGEQGLRVKRYSLKRYERKQEKKESNGKVVMQKTYECVMFSLPVYDVFGFGDWMFRTRDPFTFLCNHMCKHPAKKYPPSTFFLLRFTPDSGLWIPWIPDGRTHAQTQFLGLFSCYRNATKHASGSRIHKCPLTGDGPNNNTTTAMEA